MPILLAILDDSDPIVRAKSLRALEAFIFKFPSPRLAETGLSKIFQDLLFPMLLSLPPPYSTDESLAILAPVYRCLFRLAASLRDSEEPAADSNELLGRILRNGILASFPAVGDQPRVTSFLQSRLVEAVNGLGIYAARYLKVRKTANACFVCKSGTNIGYRICSPGPFLLLRIHFWAATCNVLRAP